MMKQFLLSCAALSLAFSTARADRPSVAYIYPAGAQKGTSVNVRIGGYNLHDRARFEILGKGISGPKTITRAKKTVWFEGPVIPMPASQAKEDYPKDQVGVLKIDANASNGIRRWRVWTSQGATDSRPFVVGELPEVVEREIDGNPLPFRVTPPVTVNGRIFPREDVDVWTFEAIRGKRYTLRVDAARLGSPLDSRLVVRDADGQRIAENDDGASADSFLQFVAPRDGVYSVRIHDAAFKGLQNYVYRLTIDDRPAYRYIFPLGGKRGARLKLMAWNSADNAQPFQVAIPPDAPTSWRIKLRKNGDSVHPVRLETSDLEEFVEAANESSKLPKPSELPMAVKWPAVCNGRIRLPGEIDHWRISADKGQVLRLEVRAALLGSPLDSTLTVHDQAGKQLAVATDQSKGQPDSKMTFKVPADGLYDLRVSETIRGRAGDHFAYRLYVTAATKPKPDYQLALGTDAVTIDRGGQVTLPISVERLGGFQGAVKLRVRGLPPKVTIKSGDQIAKGKPSTKLILQAEKDAAVNTTRLTIDGTASINDRPVGHTVRFGSARPDDEQLRHCLLAVAMPTPFKIVGVFETRYGNRGSTYVRRYSLDRGGFKGPVEVTLSDLQARHLQGVRGERVVVPAEKTEFDYRIHLPPWMAIGRTSRTCVMAVGVVKDEQGKPHKVSYTSLAQNDQIIVLVDSSQLSVSCQSPTIQARPNAFQDVTVRIARGQGISRKVKVELIVPEHIQGVSASPVVTEQPSARLRLKFGATTGPFNMPLIVRVTAQRNRLAYTSEAKLHVVTPRN